MKLPVVKSPFAGLPDGTVQMPTKPVRLTLQPHQALMLHVALETLVQGLDTVKSSDRQQEIITVLAEIQGNLYDRLEVSFP